MSGTSRSWKWCRWLAGVAAAAAIAVSLLLLTLALRARKPWITPLPGVRTEMSRPFLRELDLDVDSAYRLLLKAIEDPAGTSAPDGAPKVWLTDWTEAQEKLCFHPFPPEAPPPSRKPPPPESAPEEEPAEEDPLFPESVLAPKPAELPEQEDALAAEDPWTREQWEDIRRLTALYEPKLAILDQALAAPSPQVPTADSPDFDLSYLSGVRRLVRWLDVSAQWRAAMGDYAGAARDLERILGLTSLFSRGGCLINYLVACSCDAMAMHATWHLATRYDLPPAILKELGRKLLEQADSAEPLAEVLRAEALCTVGAVAMVYRDGMLPSLDVLGSGGTDVGLVWLAPLLGSTREATKRNLMACYQHLIAIAEKPHGAATRTEFRTFYEDLLAPLRRGHASMLSTRDPVGYMLAAMLLPGLEQTSVKAAHRQALLRSMAAFCAVEACRKENGRLPVALGELVPGYLPHVPLDPYDGQPVRYLRSGVPNLPGDAWGVYTIGEDFADDGGEAYSEGCPRREKMDNPDLVWPSHPYPPLAAEEGADGPGRW